MSISLGGFADCFAVTFTKSVQLLHKILLYFALIETDERMDDSRNSSPQFLHFLLARQSAGMTAGVRRQLNCRPIGLAC